MSDNSTAAAANRRAIRQVTLLMPVWGYQFIGRFLEFCLPTLLAPNNIPAMARQVACRFVLLSSVADEPIVRSHPAWQKLERCCACEFQSIDDLITQGNHTATITLAFERALRQSGEAMPDTCFIFLMSDYLVADGSLATVLRTMQSGAGAALAGNFQIVAEDAVPLLRQKIDSDSQEIVLPPRELLRWSLSHLHPATAANIVNFGLTHNAHANRLFWRVDENCLIGRFYLMHPIAIHPETTDFAVGSSWDYSFVPELCPSGNIATLTDSDDYLVVELQRRDYEWENLRPGPVVAAELARSLAEWTTEYHRRNVAQTLVFHAAERPAALAQFIATSDAFIDSVGQALSAPPPSHRRHPYWVGSIAVNRQRSRQPLDKADWSFLTSEKESQSPSSSRRLQEKLFGSPPDVTRLHPLWPDYRLPLKALNGVLASNGRLLLVSHDTAPFAPWLMRAGADVISVNADHLQQLTRAQYAGLAGAFDACLLVCGEVILDQADTLIEHIGPLLKANALLILVATNSISAADATEFSRSFAAQASRLFNRSVWIEDIQYVAMSPRRIAIRNATKWLGEVSDRIPLLGLAALPMGLVNYLANTTARSSGTPPPGAWSSVCMTLRTSEQAAAFPARFAREAALARAGLATTERAATRSEAAQMPVGLPTRSAQASALWRHDDAQSASQLACYRFIAAVMGVRNDVAEYGCASPDGTRLILQQSRRTSLFDPRPLVVGDLQWRFQDDWRFEAQLHDITATPLPRRVDSIYCVDFLQYISRDEEDKFVRNLRDSLAHDSDFLIIGSPAYGRHAAGAAAAWQAGGSATPPDIAAESSRDVPCRSARQPAALSERLPQADGLVTGHPRSRIYRRTGVELKALMERFFQSVFIFSMVDDIAQPGIAPDAQHVFALSCGKKD
jgi:hypothetical protein